MIGIGISTTPNRDVLDHTLKQWNKYLPDDATIIVLKDSDYKGVARTKNQLLQWLGACEHIFLADDDCYPIAKDWHKPYIESKEPHLMYQFKLPNKPKSDMRELYRDDKIVSYSHTRGAFIYVHRDVLAVVGGFNPAYGRFGYEHPDWTNRIHNAGLTTHRAMDVPSSDKLLYCLDQDGKVESSVSKTTRGNFRLYNESKDSKEYMEYRT